MEVATAFILLLTLADQDIKMTNDRFDLFDKSWDSIKKHLASQTVLYSIELLRHHIEKSNTKKCKHFKLII